MKHLAIFVLSVGLIIAAPAPASLCAMLSAMTAECAPAVTSAHCEQMDMGTPADTSLTANATSCCTNTQAPMPEAKSGWQELSPESGPAIVAGVRSESAALTPTCPIAASREVLSPPGQSLLCTFLI